MPLTLTIHLPHQQRTVDVPDGSSLTGGRSPEADLQLECPSVSSIHFRVFQDAGEWILEDLESTNGTTVGGEPIQRTVIRPGNVIRFGDCRVDVLQRPAESAPSDAPGEDLRPSSDETASEEGEPSPEGSSGTQARSPRATTDEAEAFDDRDRADSPSGGSASKKPNLDKQRVRQVRRHQAARYASRKPPKLKRKKTEQAKAEQATKAEVRRDAARKAVRASTRNALGGLRWGGRRILAVLLAGLNALSFRNPNSVSRKGLRVSACGARVFGRLCGRAGRAMWSVAVRVAAEGVQRWRRDPAASFGHRTMELAYFAAEQVHRGACSLLLAAGRGLRVVGERLTLRTRIAILMALLGVVAAAVGLYGADAYLGWADFRQKQIDFLHNTGMLSSFRVLAPVAQAVGFFMLVSACLAFLRHRIVHFVLKASIAAFMAIWICALFFLMRIPGALFLSEEDLLDKLARNELWVFGGWLWVGVAALAGALTVALCLRSVRTYYAGDSAAGTSDLIGDRLLRSLRGHGKEPNFRIASYWAAFAHVFVIFIIPVLLRLGCQQQRYAIPKGQGQQVVQKVQVKKIKKKKKKKQYVFNPNSPISYYRPDIDDSKIREIVEKETLATYKASMLKSKPGKGGPGKGGWPQGMENARVRFIRLKYSGGDWDQQMGKGSDYNFLLKFHELTGFKIADETEAVKVADLKRFPKHGAPPFAYLTGQKNIRLSSRDVKILRWYLLEEGGMIFADNGGGNFNAAFRALMRRVLPDKQWIDIANDDIVYRQPYLFPDGAPPLWHHSGRRALGMKHNGRWVVFYHQGDINDAWQTGGSGASEALRAQAFKLGINVVNYAFNQYLAIHYGQE